MIRRLTTLTLAVCTALTALAHRLDRGEVHVWEAQEVTLQSARDYANPYTDVVCWIDLEGPGFSKRVYGFWDGDRTFKVRFVATAAGDWRWKAASNHPDDTGLNGGAGTLRAVDWTEAEKQANPNRRGFLRATPDGHALQHADGAPFFLVGDTWLAASTWRLPFRGAHAAAGYEPAAGISFEDAVAWRKRQGYNSISLIAAFPNWAADHRGATHKNADGVFLRNAWEKFGTWAPGAAITTDDGATTTAKDMHDEQGHRPFAVFADREGLADFDRLNPAYFRSLDRKMRHLADEGFAPFLEPIRRDHGPSWKAYFDFNTSYARFVQYLIARYGAYNVIISGIHLDWIPKDYSLTEQEWNAALVHHLKTYGPPPFGQPVTALIDSSTYQRFGHGEACPWLTMHTVGNNPRNHAIYASIEELYHLAPAYPAANLEPYYTGWNHAINRPGGETPAAGSDRDCYFARAQMYGSVLSGALAGHVHGTAAYDITSTGEPEGWRPFIWEALRYGSGAQMRHLRDFVLSEGVRYRELAPVPSALVPRVADGSLADGLDGWSFLLRNPAADFALVYFETKAVPAKISGFAPGAAYRWAWFDPRTGRWLAAVTLAADSTGILASPAFPSAEDWAAKILRAE